MRTIPLRNSTNIAIVSDEDYERLSRHSWLAKIDRRSRTTYAARYTKRGDGTTRLFYMHREVLGLPGDNARKVDHKDGNGLNNTRENLRVATHQQNMANFPLRNDSTSQYKGVSPQSRCGKWRARTGAKGKIKLGTYPSRHEAALAYNLAARLLYGEFALLNDIPPENLPTPARQAEIEQRVLDALAPLLTPALEPAT